MTTASPDVLATTILYVIHDDYVVAAADTVGWTESGTTEEANKLFEAGDENEMQLVTIIGNGRFWAPKTPADPHERWMDFALVIDEALHPGQSSLVREKCDANYASDHPSSIETVFGGDRAPRKPEEIPNVLARCWRNDTVSPYAEKVYVHVLRLSGDGRPSLQMFAVAPASEEQVDSRAMAFPAVVWKKQKHQEILAFGVDNAIRRLMEGRDPALDRVVSRSRDQDYIRDREACVGQDTQDSIRDCLAGVIEGRFRRIHKQVIPEWKELSADYSETQKDPSNTQLRQQYDAALTRVLPSFRPVFDGLKDELVFLRDWSQLYRRLFPSEKERASQGEDRPMGGDLDRTDSFGARFDIEYAVDLPYEGAAQLACLLMEVQTGLLRIEKQTPGSRAERIFYPLPSQTKELPKPFRVQVIHKRQQTTESGPKVIVEYEEYPCPPIVAAKNSAAQ